MAIHFGFRGNDIMEQFIFDRSRVRNDGDSRVAVIDGEEHFHLSRVLRIRVGEKVYMTDGLGTTFLCVVEKINREESLCKVIEEYHDMNASLRHFCIGIALLKPVVKLEIALEKCTEIGARAFVLFHSERSESANVRLDRLKNIVRSATKQSLQSHVPEVKVARNLQEVVASLSGYKEKYVLHEKSEKLFTERLAAVKRDDSAVALIGPEGGFSENEIDYLIENNYGSFSLGKSRLRSETSAIKTAALLATY